MAKEIERDRFGATARFEGGKIVNLPGAVAKQEAAELQATVAASRDLSEYSQTKVLEFVDEGVLSTPLAIEKVELQPASSKKTAILKALRGE